MKYQEIENTIELVNIKLIPVVAVASNEFETETDSYVLKDAAYDTMPDKWHEYVTTCFDQAKIDPSQAIETKSPYVSVENISVNSLELILKRHFKEFYEDKGTLDYVYSYNSVEGGYVLTSENIYYVYPGEMGQLDEIRCWAEALENTTEQKEMAKAVFWAIELKSEDDSLADDIIADAKKRKDWGEICIGIESLLYKNNNGIIYIRDHHSIAGLKANLKIRTEELRKAIETANQKLKEFNVKLNSVASNYSKDTSDFGKFIKLLVNNHKKAIVVRKEFSIQISTVINQLKKEATLSQEKFKQMSQKNPALQKLKQQLDLEFVSKYSHLIESL